MPITDADQEPMRLAIEASREAVAEGNMPFGATLVSPAGALLWTAMNNQITSGDCTGHAELVLVRDATAALGAEALRGATVSSTARGGFFKFAFAAATTAGMRFIRARTLAMFVSFGRRDWVSSSVEPGAVTSSRSTV